MLNNDEIKIANHWADFWANRVISEKGDRENYTCASGITPSGTVHIGNFRETITVELVVRALKARGKKVRFIYSWDDYDVFRKVPKNMNDIELLEKHLRMSIDAVPDTSGMGYASYAEANEKYLEKILPLVGINPDYIYQAKQYRASKYAQGMKTALEHTNVIKAELNEFRQEDLTDDYMPISIFCEKCNRDDTKNISFDGDWGVEYSCNLCGYKNKLDLRTTHAAKLPWRIDWPMRWAYEKVDFEPAGKDHHSQGGSFSTARRTVEEVYGSKAPVSFHYDFIKIKGRGGKISSSSGEVVDLKDCLQVYQAEVVRFLFAGTVPNREFAISFDLDVLKNYEDYDKIERNYYSERPADEKKLKKWLTDARIYELSQVDDVEKTMPYQIQIRHLCTYLQINEGDIAKTIAMLGDVASDQVERLTRRADCAWNWIENFAPDDFKFKLKSENDDITVLSDIQKEIMRDFCAILPLINSMEENDFSTKVYDIAKAKNIDTSIMFEAIYKALLGKEKGPRLISFLYTIGYTRLESILQNYK